MAMMFRCEDVMSRAPRTCRPTDTLLDAIRLMKELSVGYVPVCEATEGRLVGVLTDRDAALALSRDARPSQIHISDVMTRDPVICHPNDDVIACARVMEEQQLRRIPVVDQDNILLGVVSTADIARRATERREIAAELPALFSAISAP